MPPHAQETPSSAPPPPPYNTHTTRPAPPLSPLHSHPFVFTALSPSPISPFVRPMPRLTNRPSASVSLSHPSACPPSVSGAHMGAAVHGCTAHTHAHTLAPATQRYLKMKRHTHHRLLSDTNISKSVVRRGVNKSNSPGGEIPSSQ